MSPLPNKALVLITGANTGLGLETAKALFDCPEPHHVLIGCRGDLTRARIAISRLQQLFPKSASTAEPLSIDVSSDDSIAAALNYVREKHGYIDILVNNAGTDLDLAVNSGRMRVREGWNQTWNVNVAGAHIVTEAFVPLLLASKSSPRILFITSGLSSITEHSGGLSPQYGNPSAGYPKGPNTLVFLAYRASKTGLNMVATEWARVLRNDGVKVFDVSPGFLSTGLGMDRDTGHVKDLVAMGAGDPAVGGRFCADVVQGKRDEQAWPTRVLRREMVQPW